MTSSATVLARIAEVPDGDEPLRLRRAWPRSPTRLTLEYVAADAVVAGHWSSEEADTRAAAADDDQTALTEVGGELVALQERGTDGRLRGLRAAVGLPGARLISHRARRRATVAIPGAFLKVVRPGRVAALAAAHRAVHAVAAPAVLAEDEEAGILTIGAMRGRSLHDLLDGPGAAAAARTTGAAIRRLHGQPLPAAVGPGVHGPGEETEVLETWLQRLLWHDPAAHARLLDRARWVLDELGALPAVPSVLIHRDLHDKQVLIDDDGEVAFIDLDTLAAGDPGIDLANLAAHFDLRARQAGAPPGSTSALREALLDGYAANAAWRRRLAVFEQAALLRLACVYAFRPRWRAVATSLVEHDVRAA